MLFVASSGHRTLRCMLTGTRTCMDVHGTGYCICPTSEYLLLHTCHRRWNEESFGKGNAQSGTTLRSGFKWIRIGNTASDSGGPRKTTLWLKAPAGFEHGGQTCDTSRLCTRPPVTCRHALLQPRVTQAVASNKADSHAHSPSSPQFLTSHAWAVNSERSTSRPDPLLHSEHRRCAPSS